MPTPTAVPTSVPSTRRHRRALVAGSFLAAVLFAACGNGAPSASPSTSGSPGGGGASRGPVTGPPSSGPTVGAIEHQTGATDVLLRIEQGGGFVPMEFNASQAPGFTLFGNGVVVFQPTVTQFPQPDGNGVTKLVPWRTALLDEGQIQELLEFALTNGGLGTARAEYLANGVADAPNTIFTIRAGGLDKTVVVNALAEETQPGPDTLARKAFFQLARRLQDFDRGGTIASDVYRAERARGVIIERDPQPGQVAIAWPWPGLTPADFAQGAPGSGPGFPHRTLTADEIAALKLSDIDGGVMGLVLAAPTGKQYTFILRPLLVDEKE